MLELSDLDTKLLCADYAVRGNIVTRAHELEKEGREIIYCNIGNPQAFNQKPLTYVREVLSLLELPALLTHSEVHRLFHLDSIKRAKYILSQIPEGVGAYTNSAGIPFIREAVAKFISKRDLIPATSDRVLLTDGASKAAQSVLHALIKSPRHGVLVPVPQYPLYSATLTLLGGARIDYFLDEENDWQLNYTELESSIAQAKASGIIPVAITVINPSNPTGAVLSYDNIKMIVNFAQKYNLTILADEVYQNNIYTHKPFYSFAKVMHDLNIDDVTLFSFNSMSKGYFGECGHRAGYMEVRNISDAVFAELVKLQSISLCANSMGQIATYLMVTPPDSNDSSYALYQKEKMHILSELKEKAQIIDSELNKIAGIRVNYPEGAMYAFVKIELPNKTIEQSNIYKHSGNKVNISADEQYCLALLESTGICVVPGSGFGQYPGTFHFRITFLPPKEQIMRLIAQLRDFHLTYTS
jgi:aspartate/methionine/tyrosine aminotransferase